MSQQDILSVQKAEDFGNVHVTLAEKIAQWTKDSNKFTTAIPNLYFSRHDGTTEPTSYLHGPSICLVAQGAKRVLLGEDTYIYDAYHFLITSVDLPVIVQFINASKERPYLGLMLKIDPKEIAQLIVDSNLPIKGPQKVQRGMAVSKVTLVLLNTFQRLIDLLDEPESIPILALPTQREILYRLLISEQGPRLRQIATSGSYSQQIVRAIEWLKEHFAQSFRIEELSSHVGMGISTFHHHFRALTAMSPLQFQKWLRLHEARQLMLIERMDASDAAFEVGYESPSQFSREYNHLFGAPPLRDIKKLRQIMT
jgi:AraC-like DNA-binding protein